MFHVKLAAILILACAPAFAEQTVYLHIRPLSEISTFCGERKPIEPFWPERGCAHYTPHSCDIFVTPKPSQEVLDHEKRHCMEGNFHS